MPKPSSRKAIKDWHPADIKCAMAKKGYTFARIAREKDYVINGPNVVLRRPWSIMEAIVAEIIGVKPQKIWPSRYDRQGRHLGTKTILAAKRGLGNV